MKKIFIYTIIVASAAAVGVGAGIAGKKLFGPKTYDYSNIDFDSYKVDADAIVKKIDSYKGSKSIVEAFSTSDVLNYSMEKFQRCENCYSFTFGVSKTIATQDIRTAKIKNGNNYYEESISKSGMLSVANRMLQVGKDGSVALTSGDKGSISVSGDTPKANYSASNTQNIAHDEYRNTYGRTMDEMFMYLVCDETIKSHKTDKISGGYAITVELEPNLSTNAYKKQMKALSNLDKLPSFSDVKLTFTLDSKLVLKKLSIDESYTVSKGVEAKAHGLIDVYYFADQYLKIPELNEQVTYVKGE